MRSSRRGRRVEAHGTQGQRGVVDAGDRAVHEVLVAERLDVRDDDFEAAARRRLAAMLSPSGRMPTTTSPSGTPGTTSRRGPALSTPRSVRPLSMFMLGVPRNPATKRLAGFS